MKTYFRLLSFAKPIEKFAIPYVLATILAILFNTINFTLLAPLLDTLFNASVTEAEVVNATDKPSPLNILSFFKYYVNNITHLFLNFKAYF